MATTAALPVQLRADLHTVIRNIPWTAIAEAKRFGRVNDSQLDRLFGWALDPRSGDVLISDVRNVARMAPLSVFDHLINDPDLSRMKACYKFIMGDD